MQLYEKLELFSQFFIAFLESTLNCEQLVKKIQPRGSIIFEVIDCQKRVDLSA